MKADIHGRLGVRNLFPVASSATSSTNNCVPDWKEYSGTIRALLNEQQSLEAQAKILEGLEKIPNQINLLIIANDVYRAAGDREKSLEYAEQLITHHPDSWAGYGRAAQDLVALKKFDTAQSRIQKGLDKCTNHVNLLTIATDVYRAAGNCKKSLEYAEQLITHHPDSWAGYGRAAQDLVALKKFDTAQSRIQKGLDKCTNHVNLLTIATDVYRAAGNPEKSLEYADRLIVHHPDNWSGYGRKTDALIQLRKLDLAGKIIEKGMDILPANANLIRKRIELQGFLGNPMRYDEYAGEITSVLPDSAYWHTEKISCLLAQSADINSISSAIEESHVHCRKKNGFLYGIRHMRRSPYKMLWIRSFAHANKVINSFISFTHQPFQYWSQGTPPPDILELQKLWNEELAKLGLQPIRLFDKKSASQWIKNNHPSLHLAFTTAPHYAVESDVFRIAFAAQNNCIYLDCDSFPTKYTISELQHKLISGDTTLYFSKDRPYVFNGFFATKKNSPIFRHMTSKMKNFTFSQKIINRRAIEDSFSPRLFSETVQKLIGRNFSDQADSHQNTYSSGMAVDGWNINFINSHAAVLVEPPWRLDYKVTDDNWQVFLKKADLTLK